MGPVSRAFFLPLGFWDMDPPAVTEETIARAEHLRHLRNAVTHGTATDEQMKTWNDIQKLTQGNYDRVFRRNQEMVERRDYLQERLQRTNDALTRIGGEAAVLQAMEPIHAWEYEEDLPPGEYAMVPRLEVKLSAGPGSGASQLAFDFDDGQLRAYSADWIRKNHLRPNKLRVMKGSGRSMEPTVFDGDDLLVNLAETEVVDGRVYALWYEGGERVKRLYRLPGGGLRIRSDNEREFPEIVLGPDYAGHVRIIGRVIDRSGAGGL